MTRTLATLVSLAFIFTLSMAAGCSDSRESPPPELQDTESPTSPTALQRNSVTLTSISLSWDASTDNVTVTGYRIYRDSVLVDTSTNTSYTDSGLDPDTQYNYSVSAYDAAGNTSNQASSILVTTLPDTEPPTAPAALYSNAATQDSISLAWDVSTDNVAVTGYRIYRNSIFIDTSTNPPYTDLDLDPDTQYSYSVSAYDAAGNTGSQSSSILVNTLPDTEPPTAPTAFYSNAATQDSISLTWDASTDNVAVTGYRIYRDSVFIDTSTNTPYTDLDLNPDTQYSYSVSAYDAAGNASNQTSSILVTTLPDTEPPTVPEGLSSGAITTSSITISWSPSTDDTSVVGYHIYRDLALVDTRTTTTYTDLGLDLNTQYSYSVSAYDAAGNDSNQTSSILVTTLPDTEPPTVPAGLSKGAITTSSITISWNPSTDNNSVAGYRIYRDLALVATSTNTAYTDLGLDPDTPYSYSVSAYDPAGNASSPTSSILVTTFPDTEPPTVPAGLSNGAITANSITISWNPSTDDTAVAGYRIYRNSTLIQTSTSTTFTDSGLTPATTYTYTVSAFDAAPNHSAASSNVVITTKPAAPNPMPVISRGVPAFASSGTATQANDDVYSSEWRSNGDMPQWLAYDLSGVLESQRREVIVFWDTSNYDYSTTADRYSCPGIYTIDVHAGAGGAIPPDVNDSGWVTLASYDNTVERFSSRQHTMNLTDGSTVYNWVRMRVTAILGTIANLDVSCYMDIHDAHQGFEDNWIFFGDSITSGGMKHDDADDNNFSQIIQQQLPNHFPLYQNGGISGWHTGDAVNNNIAWINAFDGRYVGLSYGTNDAGLGFSYQDFYHNYETLVQTVFAAGKIPIIPTIAWTPNPTYSDNIPTLNGAITDLKINYPRIIDGPDFWTFFQDNPHLISDDTLHPTADGYAQYRRLWAEAMLTEAYDN